MKNPTFIFYLHHKFSDERVVADYMFKGMLQLSTFTKREIE